MDFRHLAVILLAILAYYLYSSRKQSFTVPGAVFDVDEKLLTLSKKERTLLTVELGQNYDLTSSWTECKADMANGQSMCGFWKGQAQLQIGTYSEEGVDCYVVVWQSLTKDRPPQDCINIGDNHWYGGSETHGRHWPVQKAPIEMQQYLSLDIVPFPGTHGSVLERYWLSSNGLAVFVDEDTPLHVSIDSDKLCFKAEFGDSWYRNPEDRMPRLDYTVCSKGSILDIHRHMSSQLWQKPTDIPSENIIKHAIWSTWAKFKTDVNQEKVVQFAKDIKRHGFTASQIEIDDKYTTKYGDHTFDPVKFPNPEDMTTGIHDLGFRVTSWVTPFANVDSVAFLEGVKQNYWVCDKAGQVPALVKWWQGVAALLDVTNPDAVNWFFQRLQVLRDAGVDSFKYDAGESVYFPYHGHTQQHISNPNQYATEYARVMYENTNKDIEVRVGYRSQDLPIFVRMMDLHSNWGHELGLKSIIPTVLQFGIEGYYFVLPDMIGGNAYSNESSGFQMVGTIPDKELYIRWLEVNIFLPAVQFSIPPWQYDEETVSICQKMMKLRDDYVVPKILRLARNSVHYGEPIIRPLWWIAPMNPRTFDIDSQFLVGSSLLIAPILDKGATAREIYLPKGRWRDMLRGGIIEGPKSLKKYEIALDEVAYFELIS